MSKIDTETGEVTNDNTTVEVIDADGKSSGPIPFGTFEKVAKDMADNFALESETPGVIPDRVIRELRTCRATAKDYAQAFSDAIKQQGEKYGVKPGALKRYIVALDEDRLQDLDEETDDIAKLIGQS